MTPEDQLTLIQIGAFIGRYMPEYTLPANMDEAAAIIQKNLNLSISKGDTFNSIRKKTMTAIKEHDELMRVGEEIYNEYMHVDVRDEIASAWANEFSKVLDREILEQVQAEVHAELEQDNNAGSFDEAMKIV